MFYYFLPGVKPQGFDAKAELEKFGLSYIVDPGETPVHRPVITGVNGMNGIILGSPRSFDPMEMKFSEDIQWEAAPKQEENQAFIGYKGELPRPEQLERSKILPHQFYKDDDGRQWKIPIAYEMTPDGNITRLPTVCDWDEESKAMMPLKVRKRYVKLWMMVMDGLEQMYLAYDDSDPNAINFNIPNHQELIVEAFQVNYRISWKEMGILEVFEDDLISKIWDILIDATEFEKLKKEQALPTGDSSDGNIS